MSERRKDSMRLNKTSICSVVFLDIVGYSKKPDSEQIKYKNCFNALVSEALKDIAQSDRIILDTGDGAAITLLGEPESALFISLTIRDGILEHARNHPESPLDVRIGINLGPVQMVRDINNHLNVIGDGINVAQRVMSFAEPNQILVSRSYYEIVSRLSDDMLKMFSYSGMKQDKHVREHEVYVLRTAGEPSSVAVPQADPAIGQSDDASTSRPRGWRVPAGIVAVVLTVAAVVALLWPRDKTPAPEPQPAAAVPPPVSPAPVEVPKAAEVPLKSEAKVEKAEEPKKKQKPREKANRKKTESSAPVEPQPHPQSAPAKPHEPASEPAPAPEQKPSDENKSGWDKFSDSVKQGTSNPNCTDAMRSLNQCK